MSEEEFFINRIRLLLITFLIFTFVSSVEAAPGSVADFAYITNYQSNTVSVINMATDTVVATVNVEDFPVGVAASPDGSKVYVTNSESESVSVIDTIMNNVTATVNVEYGSWGIAVNPEGTRAYVTNLYSNNISVIDTVINNVVTTINVGTNLIGIVVSPDGTTVYVTNSSSSNYNGTVSIIDTTTNTVTSRVYVGDGPQGIAISPDGTKVYVANYYDDTVSVIDTVTNNITATIDVGSYPYGVAINSNGTKAYITNVGSNDISVIDTATDTVTTTVDVDINPNGVSVNSEGTKVYVANGGNDTVSVIDTVTNTVTETVNVGYIPYAFGQFIASIPLVLPVANFTANTTSGLAPLTVQFTDISENADSSNWNFGDGTTSTEQNPVHTFASAGSYEVNLTVSNGNGTVSKTATISVSGIPASIPPVANFETNVSSGYIPLSVQFTDRSQHAAGWTWTFGDGAISTDKNPLHTYSAAGTYTVYLLASNGNGTSSKTATINANQKSSGGGSGGSSSSGGGVGSSPEPSKNVEVREISQAYISNGNSANFDFAKKVTCVVYVSFDAKKTAGKTTTSVEMLRGKSTLVSALPAGIIYKSFNIWVGNAGFATPSNIENSVVCFKVEKAWITDKKVNPDSIALYRYSDKKWNKLESSLLKEDNKYLYFTAKTPGFSHFVIKGESTAKEAGNGTAPKNNTQSAGENTTSGVEQKTTTEENTENKKIPGFEVVYGIFSPLALFLYRKIRTI